ncbi:M23 family metallopeptidase [Algoriphagus pacificus]|uniref:M23 family metallopeptidase n=1 Tax=Algoriphagus pacificus TaxID=2811234 RepID=A0ABS3CIN1_9BACT|nr:M23 family metallopeptidase [Algoriphagus pacificus]MBN7816016.1 M23 family metallopeptidase [Algoriphagus pacificus]
MKLNKSTLFLIFLILFSVSGIAQEVEKGYFINPIKPGVRNYLAGNFAELRPNHFHTGLDFKTGGQEGEPILAAADGWVYRIKVSSFGYGNVIYLKHPNGTITLYGHLRNFNDKLTKFIRNKMYEAQANELEVYPEPGELPVKKGERIADSGNTGGSGGPHLHFEIRDSLERAMDPLLWGFSEIVDKTPPTPQKIAIVPLDIDSRVNGKFERLEVTPVYSGGSYTLPSTVQITGQVGLEIQSFDQLDGASNRNGYPTFEVSDETGLVYRMVVDKVDFNFTRQFLLHTYRNRFTKLYVQEDLKFDYFEPNSENTGHLELEPGVKKTYQLALKDAYGNSRKISIPLQGQDLEHNVNDGAAPSRASVSYEGNILKVKAPISPNGGLAKFYVGAHTFEMLPAYQNSQSRTYLWDMNFGIPEEIDVCSEVVLVGVDARIPADTDQLFADNHVKIKFTDRTLLEDLFLRIEQKGTASAPRMVINDPSDYLWNEMEITWHLPDYKGDKEKVFVYQEASNGRKSYVGGTWEGESIRFKTRIFGTFVLATDDVKPTITPIRINSSGLRFTIRDNSSGIDSFEANVNGKWLLMRYEYKQAVIWSETLNGEPLKGPVILKVKDQAGNVAEWKGTL